MIALGLLDVRVSGCWAQWVLESVCHRVAGCWDLSSWGLHAPESMALWFMGAKVGEC